MDDWLDEQGLYRKNIALDGSCLFRAVADYLLPTNPINGHLVLRRQVCEFMIENRDIYVERVLSDFDEYMQALSLPKGWGSPVELDAISRLYKVEFLLYFGPEAPLRVTHNNHTENIMLCVTNESFYEIIYPKSHIDNLGFCQSIVYQVLYEEVFKMTEINYAVHKMLHDKAARAQRERFLQEQGIRDDLHEICTEPPGPDGKINVREVIDSGAILFPYKVAKALDADIYRNINFDVWVDSTRVGRRSSFWFGSGGPLRVGGRCQVRIDGHIFHAYIHELTPERGPAVVFVEELSQKRSVNFDDLIAIPRSYLKPEVTFKAQMMTKNGPHSTKREKEAHSSLTDSSKHEEHTGSPFTASPQRCLIHTPFQQGKIADKSAAVSIKPDFSDLPLHDLATLQFFYNLGIRFFQQGVYTTEPFDMPHVPEELPFAVDDYQGTILYKPMAAPVSVVTGPMVSSPLPMHMDPASPILLSTPPPPLPLSFPRPPLAPLLPAPPQHTVPPLLPTPVPMSASPTHPVVPNTHTVVSLPTPPPEVVKNTPPLLAMPPPLITPPVPMSVSPDTPPGNSSMPETPHIPRETKERSRGHKFVKPPRFQRLESAKRAAANAGRDKLPVQEDVQIPEVTSTTEDEAGSPLKPAGPPEPQPSYACVEDNLMLAPHQQPPPFFIPHPCIPQMTPNWYQGENEGIMMPVRYIYPLDDNSVPVPTGFYVTDQICTDADGNYLYPPAYYTGN